MKEAIEQISSIKNKFQVVWDVGRRCTYDCSYCPPYLHNSWAPTFDWNEMVDTMSFVDQYVSLYEGVRYKPYKKGISFTGGEPTTHPRFFEFLQYINDTYPDKYFLGLTTNGAYSEKMAETLADNIAFGTLSYHPEANEKTKELVKQNILLLHARKKVKVNVMFHKDYFDECVDLCEWLTIHGVDFTPRRIGDQGNREHSIKMGWAHVYSDEQEDWFDRFFNVGKYTAEKRNTHKGRMCCGKFDLCVNQKDTTKFIPDTNFYDWSCAVNWYFLMVMQETKSFFNHQTCCVNLKSEVGPFATFENKYEVLNELKDQLLVKKKIPAIRCPLKRCGCGLCADKAKTSEKFQEIMDEKINGVRFEYPEKPSPHASNRNLHTKPNRLLGYTFDEEKRQTLLNGVEIKNRYTRPEQ